MPLLSHYPRLILSVLLPLLGARVVSAQAAADKAGLGTPVSVVLDEAVDGEHFWQFLDGQEYKGAKGRLEVVQDQPDAGRQALKLEGDFTGGGVYVAATKDLNEFRLKDISEIRMRVKTEDVAQITVQLRDGTGQVHQKKGIRLKTDGQWNDLILKPSEITGGERWSGANDGKWHGSPQYLAIMLTKPEGEKKTASLLMTEIRAVGWLAAGGGEPVGQASFEDGTAGWNFQGGVTMATGEAFKGQQSLVLEKTEATLRTHVSATGPAFPVQPGVWMAEFAAKTDLESMDNSYNGTLTLETLDGAGKVVDRTGLTALFRKNNWKSEKKPVEIPAGATSARFVAAINKETPGRFWLDELSLTPVAGKNADNTIKRLMFTTAQLGNLLFPEDSREVSMEIWAARPLSAQQSKVTLVVSDYWGAEQAAPLIGELKRDGKRGDLFRYMAKVDLKSVPLEIGRYYELHASIPGKDSDVFTNHTSLAILPPASAHRYKPEEIPWTSRNWDNRVGEYMHLTHRLGVRICGLWGKMDPDPAKTGMPGSELVEKLGMGFLTNSPAQMIELRSKGWELFTEEALRQSVRNFIEKYGHIRPMIVNLGNEPHSKSEADVKIDVNAYRIIYTEIKKIDPTIFVVGTSVGATNEEYFKAGFGEWCDAYDFHVYEDAQSVRNIVSVKYPEMFKKYGHAKPVWSTELGLNSQGMARQFVAAELYRKTVNFFAGGGANMSWFGLLYPDHEGKWADTFASAHNVFDSRYAQYAPKLDAIAYYNAVNGLGIKKYVEDKVFGDDVRAFLFRDRDNLAMQTWYKDKGRADVFIPLPGVNEVKLVRIDGSLSTLHAGGRGLTLTVSTEPFLLLYEGGDAVLPEKLGAPAIHLDKPVDLIVRGERGTLDVVLAEGTPARGVELTVPPFWQVEQAFLRDSHRGDVSRYILTAPDNSTVREVNLTVTAKDSEGRVNALLSYRPAVTGAVSIGIEPLPAAEGEAPAVKLAMSNNSADKQQLNWEVTLNGDQTLRRGGFGPISPSSAYFSDAASGEIELAGKETREIVLPLAEADLYRVYRMAASVRDAAGRVMTQERPISAFYGVPKATMPLKIDGDLSDADWAKAPVRKLDRIEQFYAFPPKGRPPQDWTGPEDLSAEIRYLWDDEYFYVSIDVKDDVAGKIIRSSEDLWMQDGLQFLIDPMRTSDRKVGKYEYSIGEGTRGIQTWCTLSADGAVPSGDAPDIRVAIKRTKEGTGDRVYEIAMPWARLAPFKPAAGNNLGFTLIVNEDDGHGRDAFMTWFGNAHSKDIDTVGDLILQK